MDEFRVKVRGLGLGWFGGGMNDDIENRSFTKTRCEIQKIE